MSAADRLRMHALLSRLKQAHGDMNGFLCRGLLNTRKYFKLLQYTASASEHTPGTIRQDIMIMYAKQPRILKTAIGICGGLPRTQHK